MAGYRTDHGHGPTWRELGQVLHPTCVPDCAAGTSLDPHGIRRAHTHTLVSALIASHWLTATPERHSLRPGPHAAEAPRCQAR
ncbi:MAG: hypothetical protein ACRDQA_11595 [Nocardioidaceae bacterium]